MDIEELRDYCLSKPDSTEDFPFDEETIVFRVFNKIYCLCDIYSKPLRLNLKCDPVWALELREQYNAIIPGYHMNKKHWNTVMLDGSITRELTIWMVDHSYELVFNSLPK